MNSISRAMGWLVLAFAFSVPALAQQAPAAAPATAAPATAAPATSAPSDDPVKVQQQRTTDQPGNNAPVWREVRSGQPNYTSIPGREVGVLVQPQAKFFGQESMTTAGEAWRKFRNGPITFIGGCLVLLALAIARGDLFTLGPIKTHDATGGKFCASPSSSAGSIGSWASASWCWASPASSCCSENSF
jgi:formate dehydrogenase subunit gamma